MLADLDLVLDLVLELVVEVVATVADVPEVPHAAVGDVALAPGEDVAVHLASAGSS